MRDEVLTVVVVVVVVPGRAAGAAGCCTFDDRGVAGAMGAGAGREAGVLEKPPRLPAELELECPPPPLLWPPPLDAPPLASADVSVTAIDKAISALMICISWSFRSGFKFGFTVQFCTVLVCESVVCSVSGRCSPSVANPDGLAISWLVVEESHTLSIGNKNHGLSRSLHSECARPCVPLSRSPHHTRRSLLSPPLRWSRHCVP